MRITTGGSVALAGAAIIFLAACGGDDAGGVPAPPPDAGAVIDADDDHGDASDPGDTDPSGDDGSVGSANTSDLGAGMQLLLSDDLHEISTTPPGTGTGLVSIAGEMYTLDSGVVCNTLSLGDTATFQAFGRFDTDDGRTLEFELRRDINERGNHETDAMRSIVSNRIAEKVVFRTEEGGPVEGDGDELPLVKVALVDGAYVATGVGELRAPEGSGTTERLDGMATMALSCPRD